AINSTIQNASTSTDTRNALRSASYVRSGDVMVVTSKVAGLEGNNFTLATTGTPAASGTNLTGGVEGALTSSRTSVSGTVGDNIIRDTTGVRANAVITLGDVPVATDTINVNGVSFEFVATITGANQVLIGGT